MAYVPRAWPRGRPRKAQEHWTILCPGYSLSTWELRDLEPPVVAITEAIFADAPVTHWCHPEGPLHWFQERCRSYGPRILELGGVELWCGKGHRLKYTWWRLRDQAGHFTQVPWRLIRDDLTLLDISRSLGLALPKHWKSDAFARGPTFVAIFRAMLSGAREIDVYGCDMDGRSNWVEGEPRYNRRSDEWWMMRWKRERRLMADLEAFAASRAVRLTRHTERAEARTA